MIAIDTNILVYSHRADMPHHKSAFTTIKKIAESEQEWAIPWPCIHEFYSIVTNKRIFKDYSSSPEKALEQIKAWLDSPSVVLLSEDDTYWKIFHKMTKLSSCAGALIHDLRILTLCEAHDVEVLYTADRDFAKFPSSIRIQNPL